ncbi:MAG TPA: winged helix DNA-binding domain-containing protein [Actinomycetes bacterium]|nr:winged helix DNA-binding domain-containing protein [Actinomycetes bacterium]
MTDEGVRLARAAAQLLHRPDRTPRVADLVHRLLAIQAQDITAARLALRARARGRTAADVDAAISDRSIVRTWGPRGTLHLIATTDVGWLTGLFGPRRVSNPLRRLAQEGVSGTAPELVEAVGHALSGQGPLTKSELGTRLAAAGLPARGQGIVHLAALGAFHGLVVLGPDRAGKPTYVHATDWLGTAVALRPNLDSALAELARRYLRTRGPAEPADLAAWSGLPLRDAAAGWAAIGSELVEVTHHGRTLYRLRGSAPTTTAAGAAAEAVRLLPAFDEYLLGWRSRDLVLRASHARAVHPGGGIIHPTVISAGWVVGTWRLPGGKPAVTVFADPPVAPDPDALAADQADVARFLDRAGPGH